MESWCKFDSNGTIGSEIVSNIANVAADPTSELLYLFNQMRSDSEVEFVQETLFNVLSENITVGNWQLLYDGIKSVSKDTCDGVVITHGTDTLAYTAAFLSFMLKSVDVPILLVSSDYPLNDERSNGVRNLIAAVDFIANMGTKGVFVPFHTNIEDTASKTTIHLGTRLLPAQPFVHWFTSLGNIPYGYIKDGDFTRNENEHNPTAEAIEHKSKIIISSFPEYKKILYLNAYPGMDYDMLHFKNPPVAIVHGLFHSGTACTTSFPPYNSVIEFAKKCIAEGIDFYVAP